MMMRLRPTSVFAAVALVALALLLGLPAAASAATPDVTTFDAISTGTTTAEVDGLVDPAGESTTYAVQYDLASSTWCTSGGTSDSPAHTTTPTDVGFTDNDLYFESVELDGLASGTAYCAQLIAKNGSGEGDGGQLQWKQGAPDVDTFEAFSTDDTDATVEGDVDPVGQDTHYEVQYDLAGSDWCTSDGASGLPAHTTSATNLGVTDDDFHDVSVPLTELTTGAEYCAELIATNATGESDSEQATWTQGAPGAATFEAFSTGATTATVNGDINPMDQPTDYDVAYDVASSDWCQSGGDFGSPAFTSAPNQYFSADNSVDDVSVELAGSSLSEGTSYCGAMEAKNASGTTFGSQVQWTQGAATVNTSEANGTDATTAGVFGSIDPAGKDTTYQVQYDLASSDWCESGGSSSSPAHTTAATSLGFTDDTFHEVSVFLTGLTTGEDYCAEIIGANDDGGDDSGQVFWTQMPPATTQFTLTISLSGSGSGTVTSSPAGIDCGSGGSACSASFDAGTQVTLTATPSTGSRFGLWFSAPGCTIPITSTCEVSLNDDTTIGASFVKDPTNFPHFLNVSLTGGGSGTVISSPAGINCGAVCSSGFAGGTSVTLAATADSADNSVFAGWSGDGCSGTGTCTVTMSAEQSVTARFVPSIGAPSHPTMCVVPKVKGKTLAAAKRAITSHHCGVGKITKVKSSKTHKGKVISQSPKPGKHLKKGSKVALKVGK